MFSCALITFPVYLFIQRVFSEFLLYARHCVLGLKDCNMSQIRHSPQSYEVWSLMEETDIS